MENLRVDRQKEAGLLTTPSTTPEVGREGARGGGDGGGGGWPLVSI